MFAALVIAAAVFGLVVLAGRAVFVIYWYRQFKTENINDRIVAYYHYYMLMAKIFRFVYPDTVNEAAEKARFSGHDLSRKEFRELVSSCEKAMKMTIPDFPRYKRILFRLMNLATPERV